MLWLKKAGSIAFIFVFSMAASATRLVYKVGCKLIAMSRIMMFSAADSGIKWHTVRHSMHCFLTLRKHCTRHIRQKLCPQGRVIGSQIKVIQTWHSTISWRWSEIIVALVGGVAVFMGLLVARTKRVRGSVVWKRSAHRESCKKEKARKRKNDRNEAFCMESQASIS